MLQLLFAHLSMFTSWMVTMPPRGPPGVKAFKATQMIVPKVGLADGMIYNLFLDNEINSKKI